MENAPTPIVAPRHRPLLLGLLALALLVRLIILPREGLWLNEAYSLHVAMQSPGQILAEMAHDCHPPLYYLLLHAWLALFGPGVVTARLFSVAVSLLATALLLLVARDGAGRAGLVFVGAMLALSPFWAYYAQEIRPYALLGLWMALATWGLWRMCLTHVATDGAADHRHELLPPLAVIVGAIGGLYTTYAAGLYLLALAAAGLWLCRLHRRLLVACGAAALLAFLPGLPLLLHQLRHLPQIAADNGPLRLAATPLIWLGGYTQTRRPLITPSQTDAGLLIFTGLVLLLMLLITVCSLWGECRGPLPPIRLPRLLVLLTVIPPALLWLISMGRPMYHTYALLPSALSMLVLLGVTVADLPARRGHWAVGLCLVLFVTSLSAYWFGPQYGRGRVMADLTDYLHRTVASDEVLIFQDAALYLPVRVYADLKGQPLPAQTYLYETPGVAPGSSVWPPVTASLDPALFAQRVRQASCVVAVKHEGESILAPSDGRPAAAMHLSGATETPSVEVESYDPQLFLARAIHSQRRPPGGN